MGMALGEVWRRRNAGGEIHLTKSSADEMMKTEAVRLTEIPAAVETPRIS